MPNGVNPGLDTTPNTIPISISVGRTPVGETLDFLRRALSTLAAWIVHVWGVLVGLILLLLLILYFFRRWYFDGFLPWDVVRQRMRRWRQHPLRFPLRTPEGPIQLQQSMTLGFECTSLMASLATLKIDRMGNDYFLRVTKDHVVLTDPTGLLRRKITEDDGATKLKHNSRIDLPGYKSSLCVLEQFFSSSEALVWQVCRGS